MNNSFLIIIIVVILLASIFYLPQIKSVVYFVFSPFLKIASWFSIKTHNFANILSIKDLFTENNRLKQENRRLLAENAFLKEVEKENISFKKVFESDLALKNNLLLAHISAYHSQNIGQYGIIDKGVKNGLKNDLIVIDENGALIGKITEVNDYFSKVLLITDPNNLINVIIQNERSSQGITRGDYGLTLLLDMVSAGEKIENGEQVVAAGASDIFPRGLLIGSIEKIIFHENDVFQKAIIKPAVDFNRLDRAFVIMPK